MTADSSPDLTISTPSALEVALTRSFDAPRQLVWEAWTRPDLLPRWMGPRTWTMPVCEIDLRVGGSYRYVLNGPEGVEMVIRGEFIEVSPPERIVSTEVHDEWPAPMITTLDFQEQDGRTTVTMTVAFPSAEMRDAWQGMAEGVRESYSRLDELLAGNA